jgi:putative endonuclease
MKQPSVYIVASRRHGTLYTGVTSNPPKRAFEHREGLVKGFSAKYGCKMLVWYDLHETMIEAITREKQIKAGSRAKTSLRAQRRIHGYSTWSWIASLQRSRARAACWLLAMTPYSTFAGAGCSGEVLATRAALAIPASAAIFFCGSEPGCTTPADMISVAASSALISISMILLRGT